MPEAVIACYRPRPGREAELLALVRRHVPDLRRMGYATDHPATILRSRQDGTIVEVFEWADGGADRAHGDPVIRALWKRFEEAAAYVSLGQLRESGELFARFERV